MNLLTDLEYLKGGASKDECALLFKDYQGCLTVSCHAGVMQSDD